MAFGRKRAQTDETTEVEPAVVEGVRSAGPWDVSEKVVGDDPSYVDLGALVVKVRVGLDVRMPADPQDGTVGSVVLVTENAGLELRAFAAPRSGGLWDSVRTELEAEVERLEGTTERHEGPYGTELRIRVPVTLPSGEPGFQPTRIVGIDGPRWMLRATFLGQAALEPSDDDILAQALRDVVVVRGDEPKPVREALLLRVPADAVAHTVGPEGETEQA